MENQQQKFPAERSEPSLQPVVTSSAGSLPPGKPPYPDNNTNPVMHGRSVSTYMLYLVFLFVGILFGYSFFISYPVVTPKNQIPTQIQTQNSYVIILPKDAVQIQSCADFKGALYARPNDIPNGPVYMVYNGQVIGLEFMIGQQEFSTGKNFQNLAGLNAKINHINVGYMETGHEGYPGSHYHVDLYTVDRSIERSIACPSSSEIMMMPTSSKSAEVSIVTPTVPIQVPSGSTTLSPHATMSSEMMK